jgi:16S rRNA (cytosine967-C5)-methyltransferase
VAMRVLHRVDVDKAFASLALDAEIARTTTDVRDAALATEIVYGSLRVMPDLDRAIAAHLKNDISKLDPLTRAALRAATYQLNHLARVPAHAVVDDAVSFIREKRTVRLAGFVNAVLRKIADKRPTNPEPPKTLSIPPWLKKAFESTLNPEQLREVIDLKPLPPPICLRVNTDRTSREQLAEQIRKELPRAKVDFGTLSPLSILVQGGGNPRHLPGYNEGYFAVQEEGAQLVALLTDTRPGESVADVCAGHGAKTALLSAMVGPSGHVTAIDIDENKLERIYPELARLGIPSTRVDIQAVDLRVGVAGQKAVYDRVLVDAPCTGLGTIHRRPDLLLRVGPGDPDRLSETQIAILDRAINLVRSHGRLIYAVCSPTREEGEKVARTIDAKYPKLHRIVTENPSWRTLFDTTGIGRIGPWNSDGSPSSPDMYQVIQWIVY